MQSRKILIKLIRTIDQCNRFLGRTIAWLLLVLAGGIFLAVILRYLFNLDVLMLQESMLYMHALIFIVAAGYTFQLGGHVRVDIFYRDMKPAKKAIVDLSGTCILLGPVFALLFNDSIFFAGDSWSILEESQMTGGLPFLYLFKSCMLLLPIVLLSQGFAQAAKAYLIIRGHAPESLELTPGIGERKSGD